MNESQLKAELIVQKSKLQDATKAIACIELNKTNFSQKRLQ